LLQRSLISKYKNELYLCKLFYIISFISGDKSLATEQMGQKPYSKTVKRLFKMSYKKKAAPGIYRKQLS
jgi:hypothetical protein